MTTCRMILPPGSPLLPVHLVASAAATQARVLEASSRLVGTKRCPRPKPGALTASKGCSKRRRVVEVATPLGLPLPALGAFAVAALA
jgi:hypothetical protein